MRDLKFSPLPNIVSPRFEFGNTCPGTVCRGFFIRLARTRLMHLKAELSLAC